MMRERQAGIVSLTITIIVSLLLVLIVTSMMQLMIRVQREASDSDQSTKAYYAAEAGVEEALLRIQDKLRLGTLAEADFDGLCRTGSLPNNSVYTCQRLTRTTNKLNGPLARDGQPLQLDLGNIDFDRVVLRWNNASDCGSSGACNNVGTPAYSGPTSFAGDPVTKGVDNWNYPAVMELTTVTYPSSGAFTATNISLNSMIIVPLNSGSPSKPHDATPTASLVAANCQTPITQNNNSQDDSNSYNCMMTLTGFQGGSSGKANVLRLKSRYAGTHYSLQFFRGGSVVNVPDQYATIDVTAKTGDIFRRIIYKVRLVSGTANVDYTIYSDTDICKNAKISLGVATGCPF